MDLFDARRTVPNRSLNPGGCLLGSATKGESAEPSERPAGAEPPGPEPVTKSALEQTEERLGCTMRLCKVGSSALESSGEGGDSIEPSFE